MTTGDRCSALDFQTLKLETKAQHSTGERAAFERTPHPCLERRRSDERELGECEQTRRF